MNVNSQAILDTAYINSIRVKKQIRPIPLKDRSYIDKISKVLYLEYGYTEGVGGLLISRGFRQWRLYALNQLNIDSDYNKIIKLVEGALKYRPESCREECSTNQYTGHSTCHKVCTKGRDLFERLSIIQYSAEDDTDRWREQWEVKQTLFEGFEINNANEDRIVKQIERAKNTY